MLHETEEIVHRNLDFLPLRSYANIVEGNALRLDWESVVPKNQLDYIMGNPLSARDVKASIPRKCRIYQHLRLFVKN